MTPDLKTTLNELIARNWQLQAELDQLCNYRIERKLGLPATVEQIAVIERTAGFPLPTDYRAFLELHNGWSHFTGDHDILSAEQMVSHAVIQSIAELREIQRESGDSPPIGFVIYASPYGGSDLAYIDAATRRPDGTADVARWDPRMHEYARFPSFLAYLEGHAASLERRIAKERAKLR